MNAKEEFLKATEGKNVKCCEIYFLHERNDEEIIKAINDNQDRLNLSEKQKLRWHKKALCLVGFKELQEISVLDFEHQGNMDDWMIIEKIEDVVVGTSIPYNYEKSRF